MPHLRNKAVLTHIMPLVSLCIKKHLKKSEDLWFSDLFRGYRKRPVA